jgi:hypothetical protein
MRINTGKTPVKSYTRRTNILSHDYQLCCATIAHSNNIKDLGVSFDSKLHSHNPIDYVFSECIKLLDPIRSKLYSSSSLEC